MPRFKFLEDGQVLNKKNLLSVAKALKNRATRPIANKPTEVEKHFDKIEVLIEYHKLEYLINKFIDGVSLNQSRNIVGLIGEPDEVIRENAMIHFKGLLNNYAPNSPEKNQLLEIVNNDANIDIHQLAGRIRNILPEQYKNMVKDKEICFLPISAILRRFDEFVVVISIEFSNLQLEELGEEINALKSVYEFDYKDDITEPIYNDETAELLSILNNTKKIDDKELTDAEIREYEQALMKANELFGKPKIDISSMLTEKNNLDEAINTDQRKDSNVRLSNMGFDPDVIETKAAPGVGTYYEIKEGKEEAFNNLKNGIEIRFSNETKEGLKLILNKLHEYNYDKDGITGEQNTKIYGLKKLYEAGVRYKNAITNPDPNERIKAIKYAKEVYEADKEAQELLNLIEKYMPISLDNLSLPGNVDPIRTESLPPKYRLDYIRCSHLASLYSLANLIEEKKWDIDKFLDQPMEYLRGYYKEDYFDKIDPVKNNENLTGDDLIFNIARFSISPTINNMPIGGARIVEGLVASEKDKELRNQNAATFEAFKDVILEPYNTTYRLRENIANSKYLDDIIINPNLRFKDLHIKTYNAENLKFEEPAEERFDEINYIKNSKESLSDIKDRIENSILKYMKNEIELVQSHNSLGVMYLKSDDYISLVQKAVVKILTIRQDEKENPAYQELETLVRNKSFYIQSLVNEINQNGKFSNYILVKNNNEHPIKIKGFDFNPANIGNGGKKYSHVLDDYDKFITDNKARINTELNQFILDQKNINTELKNAYNAYNNAETKYNNEIKRIYGANYKGIVDNFRDNKLLDAFNKKNELYKIFINIKNHALDGIEEHIINGRIPQTYYEDRKLQLENNIFNNIPPLFRSDNQYNMDEYIKLKHPSDYQNLNNDEKEIIYNSYKKMIDKVEKDFFSRKYLISKNLTDEKQDTFEFFKFEDQNIEFAPLNDKMLEAQLIGLSANEIEAKHVGEENQEFDEIRYLKENNQEITDFKKNIDKLLFDYIKEYKNAIDNKELNNVSNIDKVIDVFQKTTLKYLLTVGEADKLNPIYNELKNFIIDGNNYINNLIINENKAIDERNSTILVDQMNDIVNNHQNDGISHLSFDDLEQKYEFNAKDLGLKDYNINNYANILKEFDTYYKNIIKTKNYVLPNEKDQEEKDNNDNLKTEYERLRTHQSNYNDLKLASSQNKGLLVNAEIISLEDVNRILEENDYDHMIINDKIMINNMKTLIKDRLCDFYSRGLISEDYFNERFKRLDKNDFNLPPFFTIDKMPTIDNYIKNKYPNDYNELSKDDKNQIYNRFKAECEENRRQFILNRFLIEKGLTTFNKPTCPLYEAYMAERNNKLNVENQEYNEIKNQNEEKLNQIIKEKEDLDDILNIKNVDEIPKIIDEYDIEDNEIKEALNIELNDEYEINDLEPIEDIISGKNDIILDPYAKWIENLRNIIKERIGIERYNNEGIEEKYAYDLNKDGFNYWFDTKINSLEELLGNDINDVFKLAYENLDNKWKDMFNQEINKLPEYEKYFPTFFKENNMIEANDDSFMKQLYKDLTNDNQKDEIDDYIDNLFLDDKVIGNNNK